MSEKVIYAAILGAGTVGMGTIQAVSGNGVMR